jgi:hypothetical protein
MRKFMTLLPLIALLGAAGCETETSYGQCKGLLDADEEQKDLKYEVSTRNVVLSILFSETLLWPGLTAAFWYHCPVARKEAPAK